VTNITVGMGEMAIATGEDEVLVTYALGSCIAVLIHDPVNRIAGMIHFMLPEHKVAPEKALERPGMFADIGVPRLFHLMYQRGSKKPDLIVKVTGGSKLYDDNGTFDIGRRNHVMIRKIFWKAGVAVAAEDVGGSIPRTARLWVATGRATINSGAGELEFGTESKELSWKRA
jgi:chemotaxis protein CheD